MDFEVAYAGYQNQQESLGFCAITYQARNNLNRQTGGSCRMSTTSTEFAIKTNYTKNADSTTEKKLLEKKARGKNRSTFEKIRNN